MMLNLNWLQIILNLNYTKFLTKILFLFGTCTHWRTHKPFSLRLHLLWKILFKITIDEKISEDKTILFLIWSLSVYNTSNLYVTDNNSCSIIMFWWANTIECSANTRPIECEYFINYKEDLYQHLFNIPLLEQPPSRGFGKELAKRKYTTEVKTVKTRKST